MSGMITSVLGFGMAAVVIGVGGYAVSVATKKPPHVPTVTLIIALPFEHYDVDNHEEYKREKHQLMRDNFKLTDDQVMTIRKFTFSGVHFEKAKEKFEKLGQDHKELWKEIIVTFDRPALVFATRNYPAVVLSYGDSVAFTKKPDPFMVRQITLSPVVPVKYMEYDQDFTQKLYTTNNMPYDIEDGVDTDPAWDKFQHPKIREILDRERRALE
jgi:hypothetical protein